MPTDLQLAKVIAQSVYHALPRIEPIGSGNHAVFRLQFDFGRRILKLGNKGSDRLIKEVTLVDVLSRLPTPIVEHFDLHGDLLGCPFIAMHSAGDRRVLDWLPDQGDVALRLFTEMGERLGKLHSHDGYRQGHIECGVIPREPPRSQAELHAMADVAVEQGLLDPDEARRFQAVSFPSAEGNDLCHGDFHAVQCIVDEQRITAVVDWESAWIGNRGIDLAVAHAYMKFYGRADLTHCFLSGYQKAARLPRGYPGEFRPVQLAHFLGMTLIFQQLGLAAQSRRAVGLIREML